VRVAVPTDDGCHIFPGMLGRAKGFRIYQLEEGGKSRLLEVRGNPYAVTMQHLKTIDIYELLKDCEVIVAGRIGKRGMGRLEERGMKLLLRKGEIAKALVEVGKEVQGGKGAGERSRRVPG